MTQPWKGCANGSQKKQIASLKQPKHRSERPQRRRPCARRRSGRLRRTSDGRPQQQQRLPASGPIAPRSWRIDVALKRFWPDAPRQKRARTEELDQAVSNDSGLPAATHSELSAGLRRWCERGAWGACPECGILHARPLHQQAITRKSTQPPTMAKSLCKRCCSQQQPYVPKAEDVPEPLRDLSAEILAALRVLEVDVGPEERATNAYGLETGYRKHGKMLRLS